MQSKKDNYKLFYQNYKGHHFAAHSHHPWPDITFQAQKQSWMDTITKLDHKWQKIFTTVLPQAQKNIAKLLNVSDHEYIAFGTNTFQFLLRILSCFDKPQLNILTSDSQFHSFRRTMDRLREDNSVQVTVIQNAVQNFQDKIIQAAQQNNFDLIYFSHVFFNTGKVNYLQKILDKLCQLPKQTFICIDGYHSLGAIQVNIKKYQHRIFYLGGGYKYLQSGQGCGFCYVPTDYKLRPKNTGWYASFETLQNPKINVVEYSPKGIGFMGATFDPTALYRLNAFFSLQYDIKQATKIFYLRLEKNQNLHKLYKNVLTTDCGSFISIKSQQAEIIENKLGKKQVTIDRRNKNLRFGFGVYQDQQNFNILLRILDEVMVEVQFQKVKIQ